MDQKRFSKISFIFLLILAVIVIFVCVTFFQWRLMGPGNDFSSNSVISLSEDRKNILVGSRIFLAIDDDSIFRWFQAESQLCDGDNIKSVPDREMFCSDKIFFKNKTRFSSVVVSPNNMNIGFVIESDTLSPDKVAGIFIGKNKKVNFLTGYYLGNEFISFSPKGTNFVYQGNCFEGLCGIFVRDSETLEIKASLNNPEFIDSRSQNTTFVRWISDNHVEYKLGTELKQELF